MHLSSVETQLAVPAGPTKSIDTGIPSQLLSPRSLASSSGLLAAQLMHKNEATTTLSRLRHVNRVGDAKGERI